MTPLVAPSPILWVGAAALIAWRMYARVRRLIGRQKLSQGRLSFTVCIFPVLTVLLALGSRAQPVNELVMLGGIVVGTVLGVFGLRHTKFEDTLAGRFYTPNAHIGIALSVLLAGRIFYRMIQLATMAQAAGNNGQFVSSPITLAIYGTLAGYYFTYAVGVMRWARSQALAPAS